jgi:hypothetical protein
VDKTIHIYRDDMPESSCNIRNNDINNLAIEYKDGYEISVDLFMKVINFISFEWNSILIHCHAGQTRSSTIALIVIAYITRQSPLYYLSLLYTSYYNQIKLLPNVCVCPLTNIVECFKPLLSEK